jgi:metal-sulfur cluster biosynthetic enzyme
MSTLETEPRIIACLEQIIDPCSAASASPMNLVEMGLIRGVEIDEDGAVSVALRLTSPACFMVGHIALEAKRLIGALPGVTSVEVIPDHGLDWSPADIKPATAARRRQQVEEQRLASVGGRASR